MCSDASPSVSSMALHTDKGLSEPAEMRAVYTRTCVRASILSSRCLSLTSVQPAVGCSKYNLFFYYLFKHRMKADKCVHTQKNIQRVRESACPFVYVVVLTCSTRTLPAASCLSVSSHYRLLHLQSSDGSRSVRGCSVMEPQRTNRLATPPQALGLASKSSWPFYCNNSLQRVTHFFWVLTSLTPQTYAQVQYYPIL